MKPEIQNQPVSPLNSLSKSIGITIQTENLSKRFNKEWIFKDINYTFQSGKTYAITGPNGSGKSTLMQVLWGQLPPSSGVLKYKSDQADIPVEEIYKQVAVATPYMDLIEELTLEEHLRFHFQMQVIRTGFSVENILEKLYLTEAKNKSISNFSSGMKQRLKLGLAFYTDSKVLFLDEPGTNLDEQAFNWYLEHLSQVPSDRLVFIASNQRSEYPENAEILNLRDFK